MIFILSFSWIYNIKHIIWQQKWAFEMLPERGVINISLIRLEYILNTKDSITGVSVGRKLSCADVAIKHRQNCSTLCHSPPHQRPQETLSECFCMLPAARISPGKYLLTLKSGPLQHKIRGKHWWLYTTVIAFKNKNNIYFLFTLFSIFNNVLLLNVSQNYIIKCIIMRTQVKH